MKDELRRYVNMVDTSVLVRLYNADPTEWSDYTMPQVGDVLKLHLVDRETGRPVASVCVEVGSKTVRNEVLETPDGDVYGLSSYDYDVYDIQGVKFTTSALHLYSTHPFDFDDGFPKSRWMYSLSDEAVNLYDTTPYTKDSWYDILSELGFRVVALDDVGFFFCCEGEPSDELWESLLDIIKDALPEEPKKNPFENYGRLICGKCPRRYYIEELEDAIGDDEISRMINEKSTILCPECAIEAGYGANRN